MDMLSDPWLSSGQPGLLSVHPAVHTPSEDDPRHGAPRVACGFS